MESEKLSKYSNRGRRSTNVTRWMQVALRSAGAGEGPGTQDFAKRPAVRRHAPELQRTGRLDVLDTRDPIW